MLFCGSAKEEIYAGNDCGMRFHFGCLSGWGGNSRLLFGK